MADVLNIDTSRLDPAFVEALTRMFGALPPEMAGKLSIGSGYRDEATQAKLYADAVAKYGSEDAARKWVAPPGKSRHNHGGAVDLSFGNDAVKQWVHANAKTFGLNFPMSWEPWHVEPAGARGAPVVAPGPAQPQGVPAPAAVPDVKALVAALGGGAAPAPMAAGGAFYGDPIGDALTSFGSDMKVKQAKKEADRQARLRAMLA